MNEDLFVTVPVTANFDISKIIGELKILKSELPAIPDFLFSIGYRIIDMNYDSIGLKHYCGKYELKEISIIPDISYKKYLEEYS